MKCGCLVQSCRSAQLVSRMLKGRGTSRWSMRRFKQETNNLLICGWWFSWKQIASERARINEEAPQNRGDGILAFTGASRFRQKLFSASRVSISFWSCSIQYNIKILIMKGERKYMKLAADQEGKFLYEGYIRTDERTKQTIYDGAGYLFNNETKCFFKGTWQDNEKICGIETFPNGDVFEGSYQEGKFHGLGLLYNNVRGRYRYEGYFENGKKHGQGKEEYITGGYYEGYFRENLKHGEGKLTFADESYYLGDFQKGLPNGFGLHVAYTKERIVSVFPLKKKVQLQVQNTLDEQEESYMSNSMSQQAQQEEKQEYYYEGDFVDGYKHGIGRLYEPSGSYFYGYWEYNKPVRKIVYYNADEHNFKMLNMVQMVEMTDIDFYEIMKEVKLKSIPTKASGYPDFKLDGYKSLIDEKGLKREHFEDPEFDFADQPLMIKDENGTPTVAPVDYLKINQVDFYKQRNFKLFEGPITAGCIAWNEQYHCQQLCTVLDALTYHSFLFQKVFSRKYDTELGFYTVKLFVQNEWKEIVVDDLVPIFKADGVPIFGPVDLGWTILFKALAKIKGQFSYFELSKTQDAEYYLNLLTGMPVRLLSLNQVEEDQYEKRWRQLMEKSQKTQVRVAYLKREVATKLIIPQNYAYHVVDNQVVQQSALNEEDKFVLIKSMAAKFVLKTEVNDPFQQTNLSKAQKNAIDKLREHNPQMIEDPRYFIVGFQEFLAHFDNVYILATTRYTTQNQIELIPKDEQDKYNNEIRIFTKFCVNLPSSMLFLITQDHFPINEEDEPPQTYLPVRMVLAKEKDLYTNKSQIKKSVTKSMAANIFTKQDNTNAANKKSEAPVAVTVSLDKQSKPFRYVFGRGQKRTRQLFKEITLESGVYIMFVQIEAGDGKLPYYPSNKLRFWFSIFSQSLIQIERIPMVNDFQKIVYETAILNAEKYLQNSGKEPKYFSKVDLSERENGSTDLIIIQYFLKNEGTYLQYLRNRSNNKMWRQKLYFRTESMLILDQNDASKVDLQVPKKENRLVIIQQVGAKPYNLEGGEGICIIDIQAERKDGGELEDDQQDEDNLSQNPNEEEQKVDFAQKFALS